jgi:chloramphenicol 3-O phosphotransferase
MPARIIFLHGASSSGKSTLARCLQARLRDPFWHLSIDHLRDSGALPMSRFRAGAFRWQDHRKAVFDGFNAMVIACADAGNDLILEHILDDPAWIETLKTGLQDHDVFFVGVMCPVETLTWREAARGDRPKGSAAHDYARVHQGRRYDLELDGRDPAEENAERLIRSWQSGRRCSEFSAPL